MKIGIAVTTHNRPEYLEKCFASLKEATFPEGTIFLIVDDASTDEKTLEMIENFTLSVPVHRTMIHKNKGIHHSLFVGFNQLFRYECDLAMNLDADAIVKPDFIERLVKLSERAKTHIISGFNTLTCDPKTQKSRHPILSYHYGYVRKHSIGGINMVMNESLFRRYLEPELRQGYNWDWRVSSRVKNEKSYFTVTTPSCIDHIGFDSTFSKHINPDVAADF
jgi:glycosyltransferase involved in cell wall biosynthesis